jgi:hypothetical protein
MPKRPPRLLRSEAVRSKQPQPSPGPFQITSPPISFAQRGAVKVTLGVGSDAWKGRASTIGTAVISSFKMNRC